MVIREVRIDEKSPFNLLAQHPVQSWEWGEFKKKTGVEVVRLASFHKETMQAGYQISFHPVPKTSYSVGYFPKGPLPDDDLLEALIDVGRRRNALYIKLDPNVQTKDGQEVFQELSKKFDLRLGRTVFTPNTFFIDLTKSEDELLASMKSKSRYNIRLAKRHGVTVHEDNSTKAIETYLRLTRETATRQGFYAHDEEYHRLLWEILHTSMERAGQDPIARLLVAKYTKEILVTWMVFVFHKTLYYPYGASSSKHQNLMASNLMMWEAMRFGKTLGCQLFDLWGSLGSNPDPKNPWYGFHRFKEGFGGELIHFVGTYDLVIQPQLYPLFRFAEDARWKVLRILSKFR